MQLAWGQHAVAKHLTRIDLSFTSEPWNAFCICKRASAGCAGEAAQSCPAAASSHNRTRNLKRNKQISVVSPPRRPCRCAGRGGRGVRSCPAAARRRRHRRAPRPPALRSLPAGRSRLAPPPCNGPRSFVPVEGEWIMSCIRCCLGRSHCAPPPCDDHRSSAQGAVRQLCVPPRREL